MDGRKSGELHQYTLAGRKCWHSYFNPENKDVNAAVYLLGGKEEYDLLPKLYDGLANKIGKGECEPFLIAGFLPDNWNDDFSPWAAPAAFSKGDAFGGSGERTLEWMIADMIPGMEQNNAIKTRAIAGYSLAGLFALWATYKTQLFQRCACCSGSLWFDGWMDFMNGSIPPHLQRLYFSLGKKEEMTKNEKMATVGDNTRNAAQLLEDSGRIDEIRLEWNEGGHFSDIGSRLEKAIAWTMRI